MENEKCKDEGRHCDGSTCKWCDGSGEYVPPKKGDNR